MEPEQAFLAVGAIIGIGVLAAIGWAIYEALN